MTPTPAVTAPAWLFEGAEVAVYSNASARPEDATIRVVTIKSVGKLHAVIEDGEKFLLRTLKSIKPSRDTFRSPDELLPLDDSAVVDVQRRAKAYTASRELRRVVDEHPLKGNDPDYLRNAAETIEAAAKVAAAALRDICDS